MRVGLVVVPLLLVGLGACELPGGGQLPEIDPQLVLHARTATGTVGGDDLSDTFIVPFGPGQVLNVDCTSPDVHVKYDLNLGGDNIDVDCPNVGGNITSLGAGGTATVVVTAQDPSADPVDYSVHIEVTDA